MFKTFESNVKSKFLTLYYIQFELESSSINTASSIYISMGNLKILLMTIVVIGVHVFIQLIMCRESILTNERFIHHECKNKTENTTTYNRDMCSVISKLINIKNFTYAISIFPINLTNMFLPSHISSQFQFQFLIIFMINIFHVLHIS